MVVGRRALRHWVLACCGLFAVFACGSNSESDDDSPGGRGGSAGTAATDGGSGSGGSGGAGSGGMNPSGGAAGTAGAAGAGAGGSAGAGGIGGDGGPSEPLTNLPGTRIQVVAGSGGDGLHVDTLSYRREAIGPNFYGLWLLEIGNRSSKPVCYVEFELTAKSAADAEVATARGFAKAAHYLTASAVTIAPCIPPGGKGVALDNYFGPLQIPSASDLTELDITLIGLDIAEEPSPHEPTVSSTSVTQVFGEWAVTGTLRAKDAIDFPHVDAFPRSSSGHLLDWLSATYLEGGSPYTLSADQSWVFTTDGYAAEFSSFALFTDFSASAPAALRVLSNTAGRSSALAAKDGEYRESLLRQGAALKQRHR